MTRSTWWAGCCRPLFDLATVVLVFFLARRLFDWRVGLAASFLLALAVLDIQGSHYFAVDTFLTFFVTLTLWFTLDLAEGKGWRSFLGAGLSLGLTISCKVSVFLLVLIVLHRGVDGAAAAAGRRGRTGPRRGARLWPGWCWPGVAAFAVFRVAQPYAWAGPNYNGWDSIPEPWRERVRVFQKVPEPIRAVIMPSPEWIADICRPGRSRPARPTCRGAGSGPSGRGGSIPWRTWCCGGWGCRWRWPRGPGWRWWRSSWGAPGAAAGQRPGGRTGADRRRLRPERAAGCWSVIPLPWVVLLFVWQGAQFVKSVRYFLPIYPCLALFAGYLVVRGVGLGQEPGAGAAGRRRGAGRLCAGGDAGAGRSPLSRSTPSRSPGCRRRSGSMTTSSPDR